MTIFSSMIIAMTLQAAAPPAQLEAGPPDEVVQRLGSAFDDLQSQGLSGFVAVTHDGVIVFEQDFGSANAATEAPFTRDTRFDMASIVKSYTGMMAAQLIRDRRLSVTNILADFFDDVPADKAGITLHQLLTHSSGLPSAIASDEEQIDTAEMLDRAFAAQLRFEPGTSYLYSNTAFSIAAAIIEQVTGETYEDYLLDEFLLPAGIMQTGYTRSYDPQYMPTDTVYTMDGMPVHMSSWGGATPGWALIGNGGMITTVTDLIAWRAAYNAGDLISPDAIAIQQSAYIREGEGAPSQYGYGVVVEDHPQFGRVYWHNGGSGPFSAHWREYADTGYAIYTAVNTRDVDGDTVMLAATGAIFGVQMQMENRSDAIEWGEVDFDRSEATRLAGDFLELVRNGSESARRAFVETRMIEGLRDVAPIEGHIGMMDQIASDLSGMTPSGLAVDEGENQILIQFETPDGQIMILEVGFENTTEGPMMSGLGITD